MGVKGVYRLRRAKCYGEVGGERAPCSHRSRSNVRTKAMGKVSPVADLGIIFWRFVVRVLVH